MKKKRLLVGIGLGTAAGKFLRDRLRSGRGTTPPSPDDLAGRSGSAVVTDPRES